MNYKWMLSAFADEAGSDIQVQIDALKKHGIDAFELRGVNGKNITQFTLEEAKELKKRINDNGLQVWAIGSPIGKISILDDFAPHLDLYQHTLELADVLGAKALRMFSFYMPAEQAPEQYGEPVLERLQKMLDLSRGSNILLCHENEKGIYGDNATRCLELHQALPELKGVFDPANFIQCGQDVVAAWAMLAPYVTYLHIKDADAAGQVLPAGMGIGHLKEIIPAYLKQGGRVMTLEPHLSVFEGLSALEQAQKSQVGIMEYPSQLAAFAAAVDALKNILETIGE